jgi:hypothetical protein
MRTEPLGARCRKRCRQATHAVLQHRSRGRWMRRGEEREHVHVAIPEDVAAVSRATHSARADRSLAVIGHRRHQVKQREAHGELEVRVAVNVDVGVVPAVRPRAAMLIEERVKAQVGGDGHGVEGLLPVGRSPRPALVGGHPVEQPMLCFGAATTRVWRAARIDPGAPVTRIHEQSPLAPR